MRTPEEIKRGLECCADARGSCSKCPYNGVCFAKGLVIPMARDALAYIQQLETRLAQVERERDAAVNELNESRYCWHCKHAKGSARKEPCFSCDLMLKNNYEWRGVCEENTKEG